MREKVWLFYALSEFTHVVFHTGKVTVKQGFPEPSNGDLWTAMENASDSNDDESDELQHFLHSVNNEAPTKR